MTRFERIRLWLAGSIAIFAVLTSVAAAVVVHRIGGYEFITQSSTPCTAGKVCLWAKTSDGLVYIHKTDNSNTAVDFTGLATNTAAAPTVFSFGGASWTATTTANYMHPWWAAAAPDTTERVIPTDFPTGCYAARLYVVGNVAPVGASIDFTLRASGVDTAVTCEMTTSAGSCFDHTHTYHIVQGENISMKIKGRTSIVSAPTWIVATFQCTNS